MEAAPTHLRLSVVIAVFNEAENVAAVFDELATALAGLQPFEVVFVDDGSTDATADRLMALSAAHPGAHHGLRVLRHDRRCGKTAALRTGVTAARSEWIATMDGDGQNDPADIPGMLQLGWAAAGPSALGGRHTHTPQRSTVPPPRHALRQWVPPGRAGRSLPRYRLRPQGVPARGFSAAAGIRGHAPLPAGAVPGLWPPAAVPHGVAPRPAAAGNRNTPTLAAPSLALATCSA